MKTILPLITLLTATVSGIWETQAATPAPSDPASHAVHTSSAETTENAELAGQIATLRDKVAQIEHRLQNMSGNGSMSGMTMSTGSAQGMGGMMGGMGGGGSNSSGGMNMGGGGMGMGMMKGMDSMMGGMGGGPSNGSGGMNMGGGGGMGMMGGMDSMMGGMGSGGMNMGGGGGMGMMNGMGSMMGMMKGMGGMSGMSMPSALPGFPGASHLYHVGSTGFFLDHGDHIQITAEQKTKLNQIKEKTALDQASAERKVEEAEQQLWQLTGAGEPDVAEIEAKIHEIEKLKGDQRLAFIRAVGEAAQVLTHEQHQILAGTHTSTTPDAAADSSSHQHNQP